MSGGEWHLGWRRWELEALCWIRTSSRSSHPAEASPDRPSNGTAEQERYLKPPSPIRLGRKSSSTSAQPLFGFRCCAALRSCRSWFRLRSIALRPSALRHTDQKPKVSLLHAAPAVKVERTFIDTLLVPCLGFARLHLQRRKQLRSLGMLLRF